MMIMMTIGATLLGPNLEMKVHATRVVTQTHLANFRARPFDIFFRRGRGEILKKNFSTLKQEKIVHRFCTGKISALFISREKLLHRPNFPAHPPPQPPPPPKKKRVKWSAQCFLSCLVQRVKHDSDKTLDKCNSVCNVLL